MTPLKIAAFAIGPIGGAALGLVTLPFLAWFFSAEDIGRFTMLQVSLSLSTSIFSLAMHQAYVREYHEVADKEVLLKAAVSPGLFFLTLSLLLIGFLPYSISETLFGVNSKLMGALFLVGAYATLLINFLAHVLRMQERGLAFSATQIAPKLLLIISISLILMFGLEPRFKHLMVMNTFAIFGTFCIFSYFTRRTWLLAISKKADVKLIKKMLSFSLPLVFGGIAYWGLTAMDRIFLRALVGFEELGVYAISVSLAAAVSVISTIFSNIWHPIVYKWIKEGVRPDLVTLVVENTLIAVALVWSLVGLFSWVIPYFLPPEYKAIEYLIIACVAMPLLYLLSETTVVGVGITRRTSFAMFSSAGAFVVNVFLNYVLIPYYGAAGAALATLVSFFVFFTIRTESSVWLWYALPRLKLYIVVISYMVATSVTVIMQASLKYNEIIWIGLMLLVLIFYHPRALETLRFIRNYSYKGV